MQNFSYKVAIVASILLFSGSIYYTNHAVAATPNVASKKTVTGNTAKKSTKNTTKTFTETAAKTTKDADVKSTTVAKEIQLPRTDAVPGGVVTIPIDSQSPDKPTVIYRGKQVIVIPNPNPDQGRNWLAVVGIPLSAKPGKEQITITSPLRKTQYFMIHRKKYRVQKLTIKNTRKVTPNQEDQKRIDKERKLLAKFYEQRSPAEPFSEKFLPPVKGPISSQFGLRRVYNGQPRDPHKGLDIAAKAGTPIEAPANGVVIGAGDFFYTGNTVFLDHGQGLITLYAHMQDIKVKEGQYVAQGQVIGHVGSTGRVTGPHLHWGVVMNKAKINPLLFVNRKDFKPVISTKSHKAAASAVSSYKNAASYK